MYNVGPLYKIHMCTRAGNSTTRNTMYRGPSSSNHRESQIRCSDWLATERATYISCVRVHTVHAIVVLHILIVIVIKSHYFGSCVSSSLNRDVSLLTYVVLFKTSSQRCFLASFLNSFLSKVFLISKSSLFHVCNIL